MKRTFNIIRTLLFAAGVGLTVSSCDDMLNMESDYVIYDDKDHLNSAADTVNSVLGIINKLQAVADRTNLLGEVRADLVSLSDVAHVDLQQLADFAVTDENVYNQPRDYYAIINNCNYFLKNVDMTLVDNRNNLIFEKEYAAVKAMRAWTYLQLVLNYGRVPFVLTPILTEQDANKNYPWAELQDVCDYFINDLKDLTQVALPNYGRIDDRIHPSLVMFPVSVVLGDLYLYGAQNNPQYYREAAYSYYSWIVARQGTKTPLYITSNQSSLDASRVANTTYSFMMNYSALFGNVSGYNNELITAIPMDSASNEGYYSQLYTLYNSSEANGYRHSINCSPRMTEISRSQVYCGYYVEGNNSYTVYPTMPEEYDEYNGDLRLPSIRMTGAMRDQGEMLTLQRIRKISEREVSIYRRAHVFLRMAEALNGAGYPRFAYAILSSGVNNDTIARRVLPFCNKQDSDFVNRFDFPSSQYQVDNAGVFAGSSGTNTIGIHTRGSGCTPANAFYQYPTRVAYTTYSDYKLYSEDSLEWVAYMRDCERVKVDSLLLDEGALELCFEGTRYYDIMRFALRHNDPVYQDTRIVSVPQSPEQFMAEVIGKRAGEEKTDGALKAKLLDRQNWYMKWKDQIGFDKLIITPAPGEDEDGDETGTDGND